MIKEHIINCRITHFSINMNYTIFIFLNNLISLFALNISTLPWFTYYPLQRHKFLHLHLVNYLIKFILQTWNTVQLQKTITVIQCEVVSQIIILCNLHLRRNIRCTWSRRCWWWRNVITSCCSSIWWRWCWELFDCCLIIWQQCLYICINIVNCSLSSNQTQRQILVTTPNNANEVSLQYKL